MRVLAMHDSEGNIHQIVVSPPDAPAATVSTDPGLLVTEVEPPQELAGSDLSDPEGSRLARTEVLQYLQDFRIEAEGGKPKLVPKNS